MIVWGIVRSSIFTGSKKGGVGWAPFHATLLAGPNSGTTPAEIKFSDESRAASCLNEQFCSNLLQARKS